MEATERETIIERLKKEKADGVQDWRDSCGNTDGLRWCTSARWEELQAMINADDSNAFADTVPEILSSYDDNEYYINFEGYDRAPNEDEAEAYWEGFLQAVQEFWNQIKDKLN